MVLAAACTGSDEPTVASPSGPATSPPPVTSADAYVFTDPAGIEARVRLEGDAAVLTVVNDSGRVLPVPGVYILDARDGTRVRWDVIQAVPVADGERATFDVRRPLVPEAKHIGLMAILFGGEDYGAFTPPRPEGQA